MNFERLGEEGFLEANVGEGLVVAFAGVDGPPLVVEDSEVSHAVRHDILRVPPLGSFHGLVVVGVEVEGEGEGEAEEFSLEVKRYGGKPMVFSSSAKGGGEMFFFAEQEALRVLPVHLVSYGEQEACAGRGVGDRV